MIPARLHQDCRGLVLLGVLLGILWEPGCTQIHYSVPEELETGSKVGNIARDLGLEARELQERGVRIVPGGRTQLFALNPRSGSLVTAGRIDREELCMGAVKCQLNLEILMEDKVKIYGVVVEVRDINDNAPSFREGDLEIKMSEHAATGMRFPLPHAWDPDIGKNSLQSYELSNNTHFSLAVQSGADGNKYPELVLERALDREEKAVHHLVLSASDGGDPVRTGSARIRVTVLDANDNAPAFAQPEYRVSVPEDAAVGTALLRVNATDPDEGANAEVMYSFRYVDRKAAQLFELNRNLGTISTKGELDHEESGFYEMEVQATDNAGYSAGAKVLITVLDVNDNAPEVLVTSLSSSIMENTPKGTLVALLNVNDQDSGENGQVVCFIQENLPFKLEKSYGTYYSLVTDTPLDRELVPSYNITVTATDRGRPPLSTKTHILLNVADTNDNPPAFSHAFYTAYIAENNPRGASIVSVTAHDPDYGENAQVTYSLVEDTVQGAPLSSYISINSDTGVLYALCSFDYEQFRDLQLQVMAQDSGDPPFSSNVSLSLFVLDQNDNTPEILYPALPTDGSTGVELAPRSAEPGYLVTKVVAVDRDSGQNAWLSYLLLKASEPGLFAVGLHTGEVRTARALMDRDALKQSLVVAVQDHGQPPLSATVTLTVAVADSIPDVLADLSSLESPANPEDSSLTLYLVVAVAAVSCVFLAFVIMLLALRLTLALDLNFLLVSSLLASVAWLLAFIYNLPHTVLTSLVHLGRGALLSLLALVEALMRFTGGGAQALWTLLCSCCSGLEGLKLLGHLAAHGAWRSRDLLQRGLLSVVSSGHALLRQACDVCAIAMSLVAYVVNSLVNICLISTQNLFSLLLALWDAVMGPLWRMTDVMAAFLTHISSSAVAMAILLWTPCQLAMELLASAARLVASFVLVNLTGLVLLACVLAVTVTVLHPDLTLRLATQALGQLHARPSYHRLREDVTRRSRLALGMEAWRRVWSRSLQLASWPNWGGAPGAPQGGPRRVPAARTSQQDTLPEAGPRSEAEEEEGRMARVTAAWGRERLNEEPIAGQDPWKLLKEQEERKKCVICQDQSKTVLLLPCRHLCLCQACTEILMRHPVYHRNCPLCRRGILQTLNVYL